MAGWQFHVEDLGKPQNPLARGFVKSAVGESRGSLLPEGHGLLR